MYILILGGTGAMGKPLVRMLSQENMVYVTSRNVHSSTDHIKYFQGNAREEVFLRNILSIHHWDVVVDFMIRSEKELEELVSLLLDSTKQYIFISSARVYAETEGLITEKTPRLLEVSKDTEYLKTNEYALAKAREENILANSGRTNYTIIRPFITYNDQRLQLGVLEKENWLYRALHGRTIVFSDDVNCKLTTMTHGNDVAKGIVSIIGQEIALGETFHITFHNSLLWSEVLRIYIAVLERYMGNAKRIPVILTKKSPLLAQKMRIYQLIYSRYFNCTFDNSKIARFCDIKEFTPPEQGLASSLTNFLINPNFSEIDWTIEAVSDRVAGEWSPLSEIGSNKDKIRYLIYRYDLKLLQNIMKIVLKIGRKVKHTILK